MVVFLVLYAIHFNTAIDLYNPIGQVVPNAPEPGRCSAIADVLEALASLGTTLVEDSVGDSTITYYESLPRPSLLAPEQVGLGHRI